MNIDLKKMSIAICIPAYNEESTIFETIHIFHNALPSASIWVINNSSKDDTKDLALRALASLGCLGGVIDEINQGKGNAVRRAFLEIEADIYVLVDADLTYPAARIIDLLSPIIQGKADVVVGDRLSDGFYAIENKRPFHDFGNGLVRALVNYLFGSNLKDIMSGYRALNRRFVKTYPILVDGFEIETDMTIHALDKRFRICEVSVEYKDRPVGSFSKLSTFHDGKKVLLTIARIFRYYRPLIFFTCAAAFFGFLGLITAIPVFEDWITKRYIYHVPLAILAAGLEIIASLMMCVGLILDSNANYDKALFERELLRFRADLDGN